MFATTRRSILDLRVRLLCFIICVGFLSSVTGEHFGASRITAQVGGPVLTIYAEPLYVQPGEWVSFTIFAGGAGPSADLQIGFPSELTISDDVACVHSQWYCSPVDIGAGHLRVNAENLSSLVSMRVTLTFSLRVPTSAAPGTQFEIVTTVQGLIDVLDPSSGAVSQEVTVIEVLSESGMRVVPPTPAPEGDSGLATQAAEPSKATSDLEQGAAPMDSPHTLRFEIRQGNALPVHYMIPGQQKDFVVYQGFRNIAGVFSLTLAIPPEFAIIEEPVCTMPSVDSCRSISVVTLPNGVTELEVTGTATVEDVVRVDFAAEILSSVPTDSSSHITGQYVVTDDSSGQRYEAELLSVIQFSDSANVVATPPEATLRVVFEDTGGLASDSGGCIELSQDGRWTPQYFVCDNDSGTASPSYDTWSILSDTSPTTGEIVVSVTVGTYNINAVALPTGFILDQIMGGRQVTVHPDGAEFVFEVASP